MPADDQHAQSAEREIHRQGNQRQADRPLGGLFDPIGSMRLPRFHHEPPNEDNRGDGVNHGVGAESQKRQARACQGDVDSDRADDAAPDDAERRQPQGVAQV